MSNLRNKSSFSKDSLEQRQAAIVAWLEEHKAQDVEALDLAPHQTFADALIVCSAQSTRQGQALADGLAEFCRENNYEFLAMEGYNTGQWILVDMNDIVVNIFQEQSRQLYRLEDLWRAAGDQVAAGRAQREDV